MKVRTKRILLILLSLFFLLCLVVWLMACLFAVGQLYDSYDLWKYLADAPVAVLIIVGLFAGFAVSLIAAIKIKDRQK